MDLMNDLSGYFSRMEIVDSGRRRRFTDEAKLAIVAESMAGVNGQLSASRAKTQLPRIDPRRRNG